MGSLGYYSDNDSGLQLLGHRYYDPTTGRFITLDPIKDGVNWYIYCENNPVNGVDPTGHYDCELTPVQQGIISGITSICTMAGAWFGGGLGGGSGLATGPGAVVACPAGAAAGFVAGGALGYGVGQVLGHGVVGIGIGIGNLASNMYQWMQQHRTRQRPTNVDDCEIATTKTNGWNWRHSRGNCKPEDQADWGGNPPKGSGIDPSLGKKEQEMENACREAGMEHTPTPP